MATEDRDSHRLAASFGVFIAVPILVGWYFINILLSRFTGTCTMGDTDQFVGGMILGVPAAAIAVVLLLVTPVRARWQIGVVFVAAALGAVALFLWIPLALSAGIRGHHLCGPKFDDYLLAPNQWERVIPLAHVAVAAAMVASGSRSVWRARAAAQPGVDPDSRLRGPTCE